MLDGPAGGTEAGRFQLAPPLSQVAWSAEFGSRSLEIFLVCLDEGAPRVLKPIHAESLVVGWRPVDQPGTVVIDTARRYGLEPTLVHSTSWRVVDDRLVLTYLAIVPGPIDPGPHLEMRPIIRADLARGGALDAPTGIGTEAVLEHALRHLTWLIGDDDAVREATVDWAPVLSGYAPEPFRAFGDGTAVIPGSTRLNAERRFGACLPGSQRLP